MARNEELGLDRPRLARVEELASRVEEMLSKAYSLAPRYGRIVGRISRFSEVRVGEGSRVEIEVDPGTYYGGREAPYHRVGDYLAILDPKTGKLVLARVSAITRQDELAHLGVEPPLSGFTASPNPRSLLTQTTVEAELLVEMDPETGVVAPAATSLEPQSPVIDPEPGVLERLLDLPGEGVPLGALATLSTLVKDGRIPVKLPIRAFYQHVLIIGTTGSGKTTLLKNIVASLYSLVERRARPVVVVVDMNQDFIQLPIRPQPPPTGSVEETVWRGVYSRVKPPPGVLIVAPVTLYDIEQALEHAGGSGDYLRVARELARMYYEESLEPITGGAEVSFVARKSKGGVMVEAAGLVFGLAFVPYTVDTTRVDSDRLSGLMPGLTQFARDLMRRLRERLRRSRGGYAGPLQALYGALYAYHEELSRRGGLSEVEAIEIASEAVRPWIIVEPGGDGGEIVGYTLWEHGPTLEELISEYLDALRAIKPHKGTLEALLRRVGSLLDSGVVDVAIARAGERVLEILPEPGWDWIVNEAISREYPVVLDLKWAAERGLSSVEGPRLAAYRMLERLINWKHEMWARRRGAPSILVVIDEAHQFFPQEKGAQEEREASRQVAAMIARMARLGRARGVGLVFSTHSPRDLHDIIIQLANTKILLRTEKTQVEALQVPSDLAKALPRLPDRHMLILSHVYREGYVYARTTTPLTMHYDISMHNGLRVNS